MPPRLPDGVARTITITPHLVRTYRLLLENEPWRVDKRKRDENCHRMQLYKLRDMGIAIRTEDGWVAKHKTWKPILNSVVFLGTASTAEPT